VTANIAGIPAISIPSGETSGGLPMGLQIMGQYKHDAVVFDLAKRFESLT
jgi:Asp-tRNA(Asn)/Glu-tRNA(Gln) amidotransferase A subunit family amidase